MVSQIPQIPQNNFLVLLADSNTGIILNKSGQYKTDQLEEAHYVFESIETAIDFITKKIEASDTEREGVIYDDQKEFVRQVQKP